MISGTMVKKKKTIKKKKRIKLNVERVLFLFIVGMFTYILLSLYLGGPQENVPKKPADEYFEIFGTTIEDAEPVKNFTAWIVYGISFKLRAIEGDAHTVIVYGWAPDVKDQELGDIPKDKSMYITQISPKFGKYVRVEDGKLPFSIRIYSTEAEGTITFYLYL